MTTMRAALLHGVKDMRTGELPRLQPGPGELLLRTKAVGVCGSDLHYYAEGGIGTDRIAVPTVLGHEFAAEVIEGAGGLEPGTLVAVDPARPCGHCEWCQSGYPNLCPHTRFAGAPPYPGALSEFITAPPEALIPVPKDFDAAQAALLEPLGVAIHALDLARLKPLETVVVLGAGPIGLLLLQVAKLCGAGRIFTVDPLTYRTEVARILGADRVAESHEAIQDWTNGRGVDVALEATDSPLGPEHAAEAARIGGRVVLVGIPEGDNFAMNASTPRRKGLTIKFSRRMGHVYARAVEMVERKLVRLEPLVTHRFGLEETAKAFELQASRKDGVIKVVVEL
jgi:L-iditol 2-dehydrogenase